MKNWNKKPTILLGLAALGMILSACGTSRYNTENANASVSTVTATATTTATTTTTSTSTTTTTTSTNPAYAFSFDVLGSQVVQTGTVSTDGVLKIKFTVGSDQGNHVWQASELKVNIAVNGTTVTPTYTTSNYVYGEINETSNVIDLSNYATQGSSLSFTISSPMNDFYCTYWGGYNADWSFVNPLYGQYPGCRKSVFTNHNWSGTLYVQTSSTVSI